MFIAYWVINQVAGAIVQHLTIKLIKYILEHREEIQNRAESSFHAGFERTKSAFEQAAQATQQGWERHNQASQAWWTGYQWRFN